MRKNAPDALWDNAWSKIVLLYLGVFSMPLSYALTRTMSGMTNVISMILGIY